MRTRMIAALLCLPFSLMILMAQEKTENPFKNAKVGDFLVYKTTIKGQQAASTVKQTVVEVNDKEVTVEMQASFGGKDLPPSKAKFDLTQPYDPSNLGGKAKAESKKLGSGTEKIKVNEKEYSCNWVKYKTTVKIQDKEFVTESTIWTSKEIPLNGVVKVETLSDFNNSTMELVDFGSKK